MNAIDSASDAPFWRDTGSKRAKNNSPQDGYAVVVAVCGGRNKGHRVVKTMLASDKDDMNDGRFDVLGLGAIAIDDLIYVDAYPPADSKARVKDRRRQFGGLAGTALVTVSRLGGRAAFAGVLGNDELSEAAIVGLGREGVDLTHLTVRTGSRPIHSTIVVGAHATRNIFFDTTGVVGADDHLPAADVIRGARVLLVDNFGVDGMIRAAHIARDAGIPIVADFESDDAPSFPALLSLADHLILSSDFAAHLTGSSDPDAIVNCLWRSDRKTVVVTFGADGVRWRSRDGGPPVRFEPAFSVAAIDSTGCGDVFHGAYALALSRGHTIEACIRVAAAAAAIKATRLGGQEGIPDWPAVSDLLERIDDRPGSP